MEKSGLLKSTKIHQLKGKSKPGGLTESTSQFKQYTHLKEVSSNTPIPFTITKPIVIRYIDPRILPLFQ
jgi:hypothetical protein